MFLQRATTARTGKRFATAFLPAGGGIRVDRAKPPLERGSENVHRKESSIRSDFELLPEGSRARGSAEERQRRKGQERRGRGKAEDRSQGRRGKEGRQSKNHRARQRRKSSS